MRVPPENVIGEVGGFRLAMLGLNSMRPIVAARGIGLAEGALMYAVEYVQAAPGLRRDDRRLPGHPVGDRQARRRDRGGAAADLPLGLAWRTRASSPASGSPYLSMAKYYATEVAVKASGLAVQLLGAAGYMKDHPTELWYRDARQLTIVEGTSQVQLNLIAKGVLDRHLWWD